MRHIIITALFLLITLSASSQSNRIYWWQMKWAPTGAVFIPASDPANGRVDLYHIDSLGIIRITQLNDSIQAVRLSIRDSVSAGTGISYNAATGIITNTAPDQTVILTEGANVTITGTYPNFTIASSGGGGGGSVITDNTLTGDGSIGDPLSVDTGIVATKSFVGDTLTNYLQSGDNVSDLTNDANYIDASGAPIQSVTGTAVDNTDPANPVIDATDLTGYIEWSDTIATIATKYDITQIPEQSITLSGDVTGSGTTSITTTIANNAVTNAKFRQSVGSSIVGRSAATTGDVADIVGTAGQVLRVEGSGAISFGTLGLSAINGTAYGVVYIGGSGQATQSANFTYNGTDFSVGGGIVNSSTGFRIANTAGSGTYLRGDGTNYVSSPLLASDLTGSFSPSLITATNNQIFRGIGGVAAQASDLTYDGSAFSATGTINASTGYKVNGSATSGQYLRGNGTNFVSSALSISDIPATNDQVVFGSGGVQSQSSTLTYTLPSANNRVLQIDGSTTASIALRSGSSVATSIVGQNGSGTTNVPALALNGIRVSGSIASPSNLATGDYSLFLMRGYAQLGGSPREGGRYEISGDGLISGNNYGTKHAFWTNSGTGFAERVRITKDGHLWIGTTSGDSSAILQSDSNTKGWLPPRMAAASASAIASPAEGLLIYVTDTNGTFTSKGWWGWSGAAWEKLNN